MDAFRFRSFLRLFFTASGPRHRVVTLNQRRASLDAGIARDRKGKYSSVVTILRVPANIFPTKIESGSIRVYVIGSERLAKETSKRIEVPEWDCLEERKKRREGETEKQHFLRIVLKATMLAPITNFTVHSAACPRGRIKESSRTGNAISPGRFRTTAEENRKSMSESMVLCITGIKKAEIPSG